jgi:hypothetical protein
MASKRGARAPPPASASCLTTGLTLSSARACLLRAHTQTHTNTHEQIHAYVPGYMHAHGTCACICTPIHARTLGTYMHNASFIFFIAFFPLFFWMHTCINASARTYKHAPLRYNALQSLSRDRARLSSLSWSIQTLTQTSLLTHAASISHEHV